MDDFSQDSSVAKIEKWIKKNKVISEFFPHIKNLGICKTLNEALTYINGKYYQPISCDDIMLKNKIEKQVKVLERSNEQVGMVFSDACYIDENGKKLYGLYIQNHKQFLRIPSGKIFEELLKTNFIPAMGILIKKKVFEKTGNYDESLDYEDTDMWIRIAKTYDILFTDFISVKYRLHEKNLTNTLNFEFNRFKYLIKHIQDSSIAKTELLNTLLLAYRRNNVQLDFMRKRYFEISNIPKSLNYFIKFKVPFKIYYVFTNLFKTLNQYK
jgi:hypothetical protein